MALALSISWLKIAIPLNLNLNQNHCSSYTPLLLSTSGRSNLISRHLISRNKCSRVLCSRQQVKLEDDDLDDDESCELVSGSDLVLGDDDDDDDDDATDVFRAYLLTPVKNNNGSGLLVLSDVYGFEASSTRDFAYRVACNGYNVLVPDLFRGNPWTRGDQNSSEFEEWVSNQPSERVVKDVKISAKWMMDEFLAAGITKKLGLIGFGFGGGRLIDVLSQDACFSTAVCFYGTQMPTSLDDIKVPVLFISGDSDPLCPIQTLKTYEEGIGRGSRLVIFKGQGHAFAHMPESPEADQVAEEAFVITRNWLHDGLAGSINTSQQLN